MTIKYVDVVGVGGTGSALIEPLARLLKYSTPSPLELTLWDGDIVEVNNLERQAFTQSDLGEYKVQSTKKRLVELLKDSIVTLKTYRVYVNKSIYLKALQNRQGVTLVIPCVDNVKTRSDLMKAIRDSNKDVIFMSPGNGLDEGQVITWASIKGQEYGNARLDFDPFYQEPPDAIPNACYKDYNKSPQLITANCMASTLTLMLIHRLISTGEILEEVQFQSRPYPMVSPILPISIPIPLS